MKREELLKSKEYWITEIQMNLFELIENYLADNKINRNQFAEKLGVTKGYVSQILNGDFDHRISKFVELAISVGKVPRVDFLDFDKVLESDKKDELHIMNIELKFPLNSGITTANKETIHDENLHNINLSVIKYETATGNQTI